MKVFDFWPSQSPDLNPIEHVWAYISHKLSRKRGQIANKAQLDAFVHKTWNEISSSMLENLASGMPKRCGAVIEANGGPISF